MNRIGSFAFCFVAVGTSLLWRYSVAPGDSWESLGNGVVLLPVSCAVLVLGVALFVWHARLFIKSGGIRSGGWRWRALDVSLVGAGTAVVIWALWIGHA